MRPGLMVMVMVGAGCGESDEAPDACSDSNLDACEYTQQGLVVTEREIMVMDPSTGRTLPLLVRIPDLPGPLPIFVWSAGGGFYPGAQRNSPEWGTAIAEQGYVVIHIGHIPLTPESGAAMCALAEIPMAECAVSSEDEDSFVVAVGKAYDEKAVLDRLPALSEASVAMGGAALDLTRIAIGGWSGGSRGPQVLMGATIETTPSAPRFALADSRIVAAIEMSPAGPGFGGFFDSGTDDSWRTMRGPTLVATGTNDVKPDKPELTGAIRRTAFEKQPLDGQRLLLYSNLPVGVGGHATFNLADLSSPDPLVVRFSRALRSAVLAFLDANVQGDAEAMAYLESDHVKILAGDADWEQH